MKKTIGTILTIVGFIGLFCEAEGIGMQLLVTLSALGVFAAGVAMLGGFNETHSIKHITR